jgi:hypothetical protein
MARFRRRLSWIAMLWLIGQVSSLAATPTILACHPTPALSGADDDACCEGLAPGQICPLHKHRGGSRHSSHHGGDHASPSSASRGVADHTCRMTSGCRPDATGLESLSLAPAILPVNVAVADLGVTLTVIPLRATPALRSSPPVSPPPRG